MAIELDGMHDSPTFEKGSGQGTVPGPDLEHTLAIDPDDISNAADSIRIDEEVLVVVRSHSVVKT